MKREKIVEWLTMLGAKVPKHQPRSGWIICDCPLGPWNHTNGKSAPDVFGVRIEAGDGFCNCLAGDTRVMTWGGTRSLSELSGGTHRLLTRGGVWVDAPVKSYGQQRLFKITLRRNGVVRQVRATWGHRWFVRRSGGLTGGPGYAEVTTGSLRRGHRLEAVVPSSEVPVPSNEGVCHGLVFGDGTVEKGRYASVKLYGECRALADRFEAVSTTYCDDHVHVYLGSRGATWKDLPINASPEYLAGFISGWVAADGHMTKDGKLTLACANRAHLEWLQSVAPSLGLAVHPIRKVLRRGYMPSPVPLYSVSFVMSTIPVGFLVKSDQAAVVARPKFDRLRWSVLKVEVDDIEEVFCAEVPGEHAFALEGNLLTGNCFSCGFHGDQTDVVMTIRQANKKSFAQAYPLDEAMQLISEAEDEDVIDFDTPGIEETLGKKNQLIEFPKWWLDSFPSVASSPMALAYLQSRKVPEEVWSSLDLRWDLTEKRVCFPIRDFGGVCRGLHGRAIEAKTEPRYRMYTYQKTNNPIVWLGENWVDLNKPIIVVEGPFDLTAVRRVYRNVVSPLFANPNQDKLRRMGDAFEWVTFFDVGVGGNKGRERVQDLFGKDHLVTHVLPPTGFKDPGEMGVWDLVELLETVVPLDETIL